MADIQLARNLKKYRKAHGYTQAKLCDRLNISRQAYSNYETGKRDPDFALLVRICNIYQITLDQLILQPFTSRNAVVREAHTPYTIAAEEHTDDMLYLTKEEVTFLMNFRDANEEQRYYAAKVLRKE